MGSILYDIRGVFLINSYDPAIYIFIPRSILKVNNCSPMLTECCSLYRLGEAVAGNFLCGEVFNYDLLLFDVVGDEKVKHVDMTSLLFTQIFFNSF